MLEYPLSINSPSSIPKNEAIVQVWTPYLPILKGQKHEDMPTPMATRFFVTHDLFGFLTTFSFCVTHLIFTDQVL